MGGLKPIRAMTISNIPSNTASAITPFNPLGKFTVGEEQKDSKNSSFKAVEESPQSARNLLQADQERTELEAIVDEDDQQERHRDPDDDSRGEDEHRNAEQNRQEARELEEIRQLASRDRDVRG